MLPLLVALLVSAEYLDGVSCSPLREARQAPKKDWLIDAVNYIKSNPETLEEVMSPDPAVQEGDMMLSTDRNAVANIWPKQQIPYVISPDLANRRDDILSAMAMVSKPTCVTFHPRITEMNYLQFTTSTGCASFVGLIGGKQPVFVGPHCMVGNIVHEILHTLGFQHEHTRMDRDQYITVLSPNIMEGMEINFQKYKGETFDLPYDVSSIMHYGRNGKPTILSKKQVSDMGQRVRMTDLDIKRVRRLYKCDAVKQPAAAQETKKNLKTWRDDTSRQTA
ncbi:zinc metalloproteinase nas-4 isoform X2 [Parambassis ranga]|uniref:Metalloendopeptidase n=1 Tax=Parambassis ranga TaxID=210632 RepID=A0A6P7JBK3_9TELE|nr:zinc metalloproteinase nas-4-like isoform X2 [Parambassis ranga]